MLHIASFDGNIGDRANHYGFYRYFKKYVAPDLAVQQIEIRDFYKSWGLRKFDHDFVKSASNTDLVVFGGGAFWEPRWDYSATGTTIDIGIEALEKISTPMLFNGIGVNVFKGTTPDAVERFKTFLQYVTRSSKYLVTVRNDGSYEALNELFNGEFAESVLKVPDGGYLIDKLHLKHSEIRGEAINIAICLGGDLPEVRYPVKTQSGAKCFAAKFASLCERVLNFNERIRLIFVPHIAQDYTILSEVLSLINDKFVRQRVTVAPLLNGTNTDGMAIFDMYSQCDLVLGMRHHANICSIALGAPTIGISNFDSHIADFKELDLMHRCVRVDQPNFENLFEQKIFEALNNKVLYSDENKAAIGKVKILADRYFKHICAWLKSQAEQ